MEDHKKFVSYLANLTKLRPELLEKDFLLHLILVRLKEKGFLDDYLFKGGSCLIKGYLGYYRFSVDLDFTFRHQRYFIGKSQKQVRKFLSGEIKNVLDTFEGITGLDFRAEKDNLKYVEFGGGNKMATFKLWYSSVLDTEEFIKIQINFVERILFRTKKQGIKSLCPKEEKLSLLFPSLYQLYSQNPVVETYGLREILCEKVRAILTRKILKERDFIDVYLITRELVSPVERLEKETLEKTEFVLDLYEKYRRNLKEQLRNIRELRIRKEEYLLIKPLDEGFEGFLKDFKEYLLEIGERFLQ